MESNFGRLCKESSVPGLSGIFNATSKLRKFLWSGVFFLFVALTARALFYLTEEFFGYPITVSVHVIDSRVLPFPAVTVCNLNPVHRERFCDKSIKKPEEIQKILCASVSDLLELCEISKTFEVVLEKSNQICRGEDKKQWGAAARTKEISKSENSVDKSENPFRRSPFNRRRTKRQINIRGIIETVRQVFSLIKDIQGNSSGSLLSSFTETGGIFDNIIIQFASFYGFNVSSAPDLAPMLFLKAFTEVTGCKIGGKNNEGIPKPLKNIMNNLTATFIETSCFFKAPRLLGLFQETMDKLFGGISKCTGPWLESLNKNGLSTESTWFILLDLLESWLANLARNNAETAIKIGHQIEDLVIGCYFEGKPCDLAKDFKQFFFSSHGNCYSYNIHTPNLTGGDWDNNINYNLDDEGSVTGFTGPKFGLELTLNLEADNYMPTSREAGAKIVIHDRFQKPDPDKDAVHVPPGLVSYIGVQMTTISRLPAPHKDNCTDNWPDGIFRTWAQGLNFDSYNSQVCLKLCLQHYTIKECGCWTMSAPWPPQIEEPQCNTRKNITQGECTLKVRQMYYSSNLECDCPPRCSELAYEKFVSTGQETRTCSAFSGGNSPDREKTADGASSAKVIVYFHSLSFHEIKQEPKYTVSALLGAFGGVMGVYLGFSFLAIYEIFEIIVRSIRLMFKRPTLSPNQNKKTPIKIAFK